MERLRVQIHVFTLGVALNLLQVSETLSPWKIPCLKTVENGLVRRGASLLGSDTVLPACACHRRGLSIRCLPPTARTRNGPGVGRDEKLARLIRYPFEG